MAWTLKDEMIQSDMQLKKEKYVFCNAKSIHKTTYLRERRRNAAQIRAAYEPQKAPRINHKIGGQQGIRSKYMGGGSKQEQHSYYMQEDSAW